MKAIRAIALYLLVVIVLGALLAPWLFAAVHATGNDWLVRQPFKRVFSRALLIVALIGLWPLLRGVGYTSWGQVGYRRVPGWWRQLGWGFGLGLLSLAVAVALSIGVGHRSLAPLPGLMGTLSLLGKLLLTAGLVAVIEETFFRGGLQGALQRGMPWLVAVVVASAIYSVVHFLRSKDADIARDAVVWSSGFTYLGRVLTRSFAHPDFAVGFTSLFLAGGILGWAYAKTGTLYLSIGLHAGWVLANEFVRELRGGKIIEDWLTWPALLALGVLIAWLCRRRSSWRSAFSRCD
jgi:hypothetical protein